MNAHSRHLDWKKYDSRVQTLERRLEALLSLPQYSGDDRRLARVYVGFGRLVVDRLEPTLVTHLTRAEEYARTNVFPEELEGVSHELGIVAQQLSYQESQSGIETDQPFLYQLLESCTRREFAIYPATDVEPVARMAAIGVPADDIESVVYSVYPELRSR